MIWELDALKILAKNQTVPGVALKDAITEIERLHRELEKANKDASFLYNVMQRATSEDGCDVGIMLEDAELARKQHIKRIKKGGE